MDNLNALAGQTLGQYTITEQIGEGGMATVFKAYQPSLNRYVALKILPPAVAKKGDFVERFTREAQAIGNLHHPHILAVYDSGQDKGFHYLAMRYVEKARTLTEVMKQRLDNGRIVTLIGQIAGALDHAHKAGIIHRDVKPSNVLMDGDWPLLGDFGLAKMVEDVVELTGTGVGMGTPAYMSPEQGMGKKVDHRTDIYALGIILYEMLTGQIPHKAETPIATVIKRLNEPLPLPRSLNPNIPEAVERVLLKALAVDPKLRFDSAGDMAAALKAAFGEKANELLTDVDKTYLSPAEGKTSVPFPEATLPSTTPLRSPEAGKRTLPAKLFSFSAIALLIGLVLCGLVVFTVFQFRPVNTSDESEEVPELIQEDLEAGNEPPELALASTETPTPAPTGTTPAAPVTPATAPTATPAVIAAELTGQEVYELALIEAMAWQGDPVLSDIETTALDFLDAEGKSGSWILTFYSDIAGEMYHFRFTNGVLQSDPPVSVPREPNLFSFDEAGLLDTKALYETAAAAGGSAFIAEGYQPSIALTEYPLDDSIATWYINYMNPGTFEVAFTVIINARSGEVIQALDLR